MGIQYGNLTLHGVQQEELVNYLSEVGLDAYVSPNINNFVTIYDKAASGLNREDITLLSKLEPKFKAILNQYRYGSYAALVCLANHLSKVFSCSALAVHVYDGNFIWYHLCQNGEMLDEYTTCGSDKWEPGKPISSFPSLRQIKGGNASKLCKAFAQETVIEQVDIILRKPEGRSDETSLLNLPLNEALLRIEKYSSPTIRHEALARVLGICPGFVVGLNYVAVDTGELAEMWEDFCDDEEDNFLTASEVEVMLRKTTPKFSKSKKFLETLLSRFFS